MATLEVDSGRARRVAEISADAKKKMEQAVRRDLAKQMQAESEARLQAASGWKVAEAQQERAAVEERWHAREADWRKREKELEKERDELTDQLQEAREALLVEAQVVARRAEESSGARDQLLATHARVLEDSAAANAALRKENARLASQQKVYESEVQNAEHEARMKTMESEEVRKSMAAAVRELVPLRKEVIEQRQALKEVDRATAQLKHAKEEDQASYVIAKKATAKILRNKHMKTLDEAVKNHKKDVKEIEKQKKADEAKQRAKLEQELSGAQAEFHDRLRQQAEEEEQRRQAMQESLRKQLEGEEQARMEELANEYEVQMQNERHAAAARLVQTHKRMNKEYQSSVESKAAAQEKSTAELLKQYADDAAQKLAAMQSKADGHAAELEWGRKQLAIAQAGLEGMADLVATLLHERQEGWVATDAKLREAEASRDTWRGEAERLDKQLKRTIAANDAEVRRMNALHKVTLTTMLAECAVADEDVESLRHWRSRATDMSEELTALRKAHQDLLMESRQQQFDLKKEMSDKVTHYETRVAKLQKDLESLQLSYSKLKVRTTQALDPLRTSHTWCRGHARSAPCSPLCSVRALAALTGRTF